MSADIPYHPVLEASLISSEPENPQHQAVHKLSGYVGPASQNGWIRIYNALDDLSHYLEFESSAIVHSTETPASEMPDNAQSFWVNANARVRWIREYPNVGSLVSSVRSIMYPGANVADGRPGPQYMYPVGPGPK
jgi:hypothetical protein